MTDDLGSSASPRRRPSSRWRFAIAFLAGIVAVLGVGVGGLYAYDRQYDGHVLPGVRVGSLDLSGLDAMAAKDRLERTYAQIAHGRVLVSGPKGELTLGYAELGRTPDIDAMLGAALDAGRDDGLGRLLGDARTALRGVTIAPAASLDTTKLDDQLAQSPRSTTEHRSRRPSRSRTGPSRRPRPPSASSSTSTPCARSS